MVVFDAETDTGADWSLVSDRVMGGVSDGRLSRERMEGRMALRMRGEVRLENDGGFVQMARDLRIDAAPHDGLEITVLGNGERYNLHLRTADVTRPWQSYRATFEARGDWAVHVVRFADLTPHRLDAPFDPSALRRVGLVAIGRAFHADLSLARMVLV